MDGFNLKYPVALPPRMRVTQFLHGFWLDKLFSYFVIKVLLGISSRTTLFHRSFAFTYMGTLFV
jgi:hypothetical protein